MIKIRNAASSFLMFTLITKYFEVFGKLEFFISYQDSQKSYYIYVHCYANWCGRVWVWWNIFACSKHVFKSKMIYCLECIREVMKDSCSKSLYETSLESFNRYLQNIFFNSDIFLKLFNFVFTHFQMKNKYLYI